MFSAYRGLPREKAGKSLLPENRGVAVYANVAIPPAPVPLVPAHW